MDATLVQQLKKSLEEEHEKLVGELKSVATKDSKMMGDWDAKFPQFETQAYGSHGKLEEEADEVEEYETRLAAEHSLESRLLEVNQALGRIGKGTYGVCAQCRKEIIRERMQANPAAEFCVEHASL